MDLMDYRRKIIANSPHLASASGAVATFSDGADLPLKSLIVDIEPVQSGSGDPSPDNVRPISGWSGVNLTRCGKNLLQCPTSGGRTNSGITWTYNSNGSVTASGKATGNSWSYGSPPATVTLPQGTYTASVTSPFGLVVQNLTDGGYFYNGGNSKVTFTLNKQTQIGVHARVANGTTINATTGIQIEKGSTATPYEPYNGLEVAIDLGQTVYGGTLNPLTGVLTAYPYYASYNGETLTGRWVSDRDKYVAGTTPTIGAQVVDMSGTGTEIQLTPHQIRSLYGNNTIFANTGNVALEYWAHA